MNISKNQWIAIGVVGAVAVWYFFLRKKKMESGYDSNLMIIGNESGYGPDFGAYGSYGNESGYKAKPTGSAGDGKQWCCAEYDTNNNCNQWESRSIGSRCGTVANPRGSGVSIMTRG